MKLWKGFKLARQYFFSFLGVVSFTVALLVSVAFITYANLQIKDAKLYSVKQLEQVSNMTDLLYEQMRSISNQILTTADTNRCLMVTDFNRLEEATASIKLREIQSANPSVRYVSFYNSASNRFVSSSTVDFLTEFDVEYYSNSLKDAPDTCTLRLIGTDYATQPTKALHVYSFIFRVSVRYLGTDDFVIVDVNEDYFTGSIGNLRSTNGYQQVLLLDRKGNAISANTFLEDESVVTKNEEICLDLSKLPELTNTSGYFSFKLNDGTRALITYAKAPFSGMTILNILPYSDIYGSLMHLAAITFLIGFVVLILASVLSYRTSARLSAPIEILYNNYVTKPSSDKGSANELEALNHAFRDMYSKTDKLEQGLISSYSDSKKRAIQRLFHGEIEQIAAAEELYKSYGIPLDAPYYAVLAIRCVSKDNNLNPDDSNYFILNYALENITTEVLQQFGSVSAYRNTRNMLTVLLPLQQNAYPDHIENVLNKIIEVMTQEFSVETTVCIGNIVESAENINMCYEATVIALEYTSIQNHGRVFFAGEVTHTFNLSQYHNRLHIKLSEYIRNNDLDACSQEFDLALAYMSNVSFATAITYFNHVMMMLIDDFSTTFADDNTYGLLIDKLNRIDHRINNVYALRRQCMEFITLLVHHLSINHKSGNEQAIESARVYIDKNYANPDLSLRMLADMAGLSPSYFGKNFTAHTSLSFNDYLTNTRMKKAAQLLSESKLPINQISEAVGFLNTNYFYSVFKKKFGVTPLAYRRSGGSASEAPMDSAEKYSEEIEISN